MKFIHTFFYNGDLLLLLRKVSFDPRAESEFLNGGWGKIDDSEENKTTQWCVSCLL